MARTGADPVHCARRVGAQFDSAVEQAVGPHWLTCNVPSGRLAVPPCISSRRVCPSRTTFQTASLPAARALPFESSICPRIGGFRMNLSAAVLIVTLLGSGNAALAQDHAM